MTGNCCGIGTGTGNGLDCEVILREASPLDARVIAELHRQCFFDGLGGTGSSLGTVVFADGSLITAADGVTESVNSGGTIIAGDGGTTLSNWKHYVTSKAIPGGAQSVTLIYNGIQNDSYAENVSFTSVPEPGSIALLGIAGLLSIGIGRRRRKRS